MEDITHRALRIFGEVDIVFCEDTRNTRKILSHYGISATTESYHAQSADSKIARIIDLLKEGKNIAYATDSGTPGISDPSSLLVARVREALAAYTGSGTDSNAGTNADNVSKHIAAIPGPSALTAAVSIAGVPIDEFIFIGFLPHKKGRETLFKEIATSARAFIFYESTHRIEKALQSLHEHMFATDSLRPILIGRELTKMFEETVLLLPVEHLARMEKDPNKKKGEFVVIVPRA
jgi:16S rRNA (cytidine1402-2'-O)-methyltransferase